MSVSHLDRLYHAIKNATLRAQDFDGLVDPNCYVEIHSLQNPNLRFLATPLHFAFFEKDLNNLVVTVGELCKLGALAHIPVLIQTNENLHQIETHGIWPSENVISDREWTRLASKATVLHFCPPECVAALVQVTGVDLEKTDSFNRTPLQILLDYDFVWTFSFEEDASHQEAILELVRAGANVNRKEGSFFLGQNRWCTPLFLSLRLGFDAGTRLMVQRATPDVLEDALHTVVLHEHGKSIVAVELAKRECQRLRNTCFGLAALDLPVLCLLRVFEAGTIVDGEWKQTALPSMGKQWTVAKTIKRAATFC